MATSAKKKQPKRQKHAPQRTCVVCREKKDKRDLLRIVNNADDGVMIDLTGKKNGRGAYVCSSATCWDKVKQTNILDSALKAQVGPDTKMNLINRFQELQKEMGITG